MSLKLSDPVEKKVLAILIREFGNICPDAEIESDDEAYNWMLNWEGSRLHVLECIAEEISDVAKSIIEKGKKNGSKK